MKKLLFVILLCVFTSVSHAACTLQWDYSADSDWLDGWRFYQGGSQVGESTDNALRSIDCATAGIVAGPGDVTMTAFRGVDESVQSDPAAITLAAPSMSLTISVP